MRIRINNYNCLTKLVGKHFLSEVVDWISIVTLNFKKANFSLSFLLQPDTATASISNNVHRLTFVVD